MVSVAVNTARQAARRVGSRCGHRFFAPFVSLILPFAAAIVLGQFGLVATCNASINYGSHVGDTVTYEDVTEDSTTDALPLYLDPIYSADSINFNPALFGAYADALTPSDNTDGQLTFFVQAHAGRAINTLELEEGGFLTVVGVGTNATYTDVSTTGTVRILHVDGLPIVGGPIDIPIDLTFIPNGDGSWKLGANGLALLEKWEGAQFFNLNQALTDNSVSHVLGATRIFVDLTNALYAQAESTAVAQIDKKDFGGVSFTINRPIGSTPIPEPASILIFLVVALGPWLARRF